MILELLAPSIYVLNKVCTPAQHCPIPRSMAACAARCSAQGLGFPDSIATIEIEKKNTNTYKGGCAYSRNAYPCQDKCIPLLSAPAQSHAQQTACTIRA